MALSIAVKATVTESTTRYCPQHTPDTRSNIQWKPHLRGGKTQHQWTPDLFTALSWSSYLKEHIRIVELLLSTAASEVVSSDSLTFRVPSLALDHANSCRASPPEVAGYGSFTTRAQPVLASSATCPWQNSRRHSSPVQSPTQPRGTGVTRCLCEDTWLCFPLPPTQRPQKHLILEYFKHMIFSHYIFLSCKGKP